jgi:hypothetical protein
MNNTLNILDLTTMQIRTKIELGEVNIKFKLLGKR